MANTDADELIHSLLSHGDRIYDPVKAHEYYLRTRDLKGKRSVSALKSQKKKEGWAYVQDRVKDLKKSELKTASDTNKADVQRLRENGKQYRTALSEKIKALMGQITENVKGEIAALPSNLTKEERAIEVAKIRDKASGERASNKEARASERDKIANDLKGAVDGARAHYDQVKEAIKTKYEKKLQSEYDAIRTGA